MKQFDVLYIHPSRNLESGNFCYAPVGIPGLVNALQEEGFSVIGLNYAMEKTINPGFKLKSFLKKYQAKGIAIDLHWTVHSFGAIEIARMCKQVQPNSQIILGGITSSIFANEILKSFPFVDFIISGDAEEPFSLLMKQTIRTNFDYSTLRKIPNLTFKTGKKIFVSKNFYVASREDLDKLNFTDITFLRNWERYLKTDTKGYDGSKYMATGWVCVGRGCIYNCSYCGGSEYAHRTITRRVEFTIRSPFKVADDVISWVEQGCRQIAFTHDLQMLNNKYYEAVFKKVRKEHFDVGIYVELNRLPEKKFVKTLSKTFIQSLSKIVISPDSADDAIRSFNGRVFTNEQLFGCLKWLRDYFFPLDIYFSVPLPGETRKSLHSIFSFIKRICSIYPVELLNFFCTPLLIDPCSLMWSKPEKYRIKVFLKNFYDYYNAMRKTVDRTLLGYETDKLGLHHVRSFLESYKDFLREFRSGFIDVPSLRWEE